MPLSSSRQVTGNVIFTDDFASETLDSRWVFLRNPQMDNYKTTCNFKHKFHECYWLLPKRRITT